MLILEYRIFYGYPWSMLKSILRVVNAWSWRNAGLGWSWQTSEYVSHGVESSLWWSNMAIENPRKNGPFSIAMFDYQMVVDAGAGMGGGNDEREQTLNQILTDSWQGWWADGPPGIAWGLDKIRRGSWPKSTNLLFSIWVVIKMLSIDWHRSFMNQMESFNRNPIIVIFHESYNRI